AFLRHAAAVLGQHGVRVERVMTDRALAYTRSHAFQAALDERGARHVVTRPYRPQTNGKVERFHRTMVEEWAYVRLYTSIDQRLPRSLTGSTPTIDDDLTPRSVASLLPPGSQQPEWELHLEA